MKKLFAILFFIPFISCYAVTTDMVNFHNESSDTCKISEILHKTIDANFTTPNERVGFIARQFLGLPYVAHTLEGDTEMLTINVDELDCTTFVETVIAMAITAEEGSTSWRDYAKNLESIRYRDGVLNGYSSRLHYISDWIINNSARGNFYEATTDICGSSFITKTINFMSTHRSSYNSLKNNIEFNNIKEIESNYINHKYPIIKKASLLNKSTRKDLKDGDIVALTTKTNGLDVSHMGLIAIVDGVPHLMHASMKAMKVIIDPLPLHKYLSNSKSLTGIRVIRLNK